MSGCVAPEDAGRTHEYFALGDYVQAYQEAASARSRNPGDSRLERQYETVRIAYLLNRAQELVFADRETDAIGVLQEVLTALPENPIAKAWIIKARHKLAIKGVSKGNLARGEGKLRAALVFYREALGQMPGDPAAKAGVAKVAETWRQRKVKAAEHYLEGMRALGGPEDVAIRKLLTQCEYHMDIALQNDPELASAKSRRQNAHERLAEIRFADAQGLEEDGFYAAALRAYRNVKQELPQREGIDDRIARMQREVEVGAIIRRGEVALFAGKLEASTALFEKAYDKSLLQRPYISEMLVLAKERLTKARYRKALDLELENHYESAVAAYKAIDEQHPGYADVRARISDLESAIEVAGEAYDRGRAALAKDDTTAAIEAFDEALLVYPGYRGLDAKIAELKAAAGDK